MTAAEEFAPAKINLTLHVTGQRADGYHLLDSLVVFADIGDRLWLTPAAQMALDVGGRFADGVPRDNRNLVWRAAELAGQSLRIRLEKNLPHGAGIGGGSSDAAAVLRFCGALEHAPSLGADVPVCLSPLPQRMQGIGEELAPVAVPPCHLLLVNPGVDLPTPEVFKALEQREHAGMGPLPRWPSAAEFTAWLAAQRNDLEPAACRLAPVIGAVLAQLGDAPVARMSGSGATCFGLYENADLARAAARRIAAANPGWWVQPAAILSGALPAAG